MNKRIRELAVQAGAEFFKETGMKPIAGGFYEEVEIESHNNLDIEKFAELIVQECARIGELKEQGFSEYDPDISVGHYMRQHFGVEDSEDEETCPTCDEPWSGTSCGIPDCGWITGEKE